MLRSTSSKCGDGVKGVSRVVFGVEYGWGAI